LERRVAGDVHDPHRQWDLVTFRTPRLAMPVPTLGTVSEQRSNCRWKAEAVCEHLRNLAERCDLFPERLRQFR
jgi:hypothetical protein